MLRADLEVVSHRSQPHPLLFSCPRPFRRHTGRAVRQGGPSLPVSPRRLPVVHSQPGRRKGSHTRAVLPAGAPRQRHWVRPRLHPGHRKTGGRRGTPSVGSWRPVGVRPASSGGVGERARQSAVAPVDRPGFRLSAAAAGAGQGSARGRGLLQRLLSPHVPGGSGFTAIA